MLRSIFSSSPIRRLTFTLFAASLLLALPASLRAQDPKTISILIHDGKTGKTITPDNYIVRVDHLNTAHNDWLSVKDDGSVSVTVPAKTTFLSIQATYHNSMDFYINCDAGMEKDTSTLHWYSIADILASGVSAPNECYKGKFADATHVAPKPGQFIFYVRPISAMESLSD